MNLDVLVVMQIVILVIVAGLLINVGFKLAMLERSISITAKDENWLYSAMKKACTNAIKEYDEGEDPPPVTEELEVIVEQTSKKKRR